jgi:spore germination protein KB
MVKENISLIQLLSLVFNFLLGSSIVTGLGRDIGRDAWIGIFLATLIGIGLMYGFYSLNHLLPTKNLFEMMEYCFKRPIAIFFSLVYIIYFLYIACRLTRTFSELITGVIMPVTPIGVISLSFLLVIAYIMYLGLEVLARVSEIFTPYLIGLFLLLIIFLVAGGEIDFHRMQPILGDGIKPIIKGLPSLITFPFGELITFMVILNCVTKFQKGKKISVMGVLLAGSTLTLGTILMMITLGEYSFQFTDFPMLMAARRIAIGGFIERVDAFVVFILFLSVLVKTCIYLYVGTKGLEYIFQLPYRYFVVPSSMVVSVFSTIMATNYAEHIEKAQKVTLYYMHIPMQLVFPAVLMVMLTWKVKRHNSQKNGVRL